MTHPSRVNEPVELGEIQGVRITAERSAIVAGVVIWLVSALVGRRVWRLRPGAAVTGGLVVTLLHFFGELWHQMGHARAARKVGYPMVGIHMWSALGSSIYPADEPELPASVHVARALGGPQASLLLTLLAGAVALLTWPMRSAVSMVTTLFALDNLLVFTLGAFLPLPFMKTDGSVLLKYGRSRRSIVIQE